MLIQITCLILNLSMLIILHEQVMFVQIELENGAKYHIISPLNKKIIKLDTLFIDYM